MARWYKLMNTGNEETARLVVRVLREKGYEADVQTSYYEKSVWVRDEPEIVNALIEIIEKNREIVPIVIDTVKAWRTVKSYSEFSEIIPPREVLYYRIMGVEVERPPEARFEEELLSRIDAIERRVREMRWEDLISEIIELRRSLRAMKEEDIPKILKRVEELEKRISER
jgi:hypothetical protein